MTEPGGAEVLRDRPEGLELEVVDDDLTWGHPGALGLVALLLSVLVLMGASLLQGRGYAEGLLPQQDGNNHPGDVRAYVRVSGVLTCLLAFVPVVLARVAWGRVVPSDGPWVDHVVRAAGCLSCFAALLALVRLVVLLTTEPAGQLPGFFF